MRDQSLGSVAECSHLSAKVPLLMPCNLFVVRLTGGSHAGEGNVYAYNPALGKEGPVCDDYWNMAAVSSYLEVLDLISR